MSSPLGESRSRHSFGTVLTLDIFSLSFSGFVGEGHGGSLPVPPQGLGCFRFLALVLAVIDFGDGHPGRLPVRPRYSGLF